MTRETSLWNWLKRVSKDPDFGIAHLHMGRVENSVARGMPDVEGFLHGGNQFWIELKSATRPKHPQTPVRFAVRDREAQVEWLKKRCRLGGRAWLLLQVGSGPERRLYLVNGMLAKKVYAGVTESRLRSMSVLVDDRPSPGYVISAAAEWHAAY